MKNLIMSKFKSEEIIQLKRKFLRQKIAQKRKEWPLDSSGCTGDIDAEDDKKKKYTKIRIKLITNKTYTVKSNPLTEGKQHYAT